MPTLCPNITFPHQQDFFPIRSVTKSSTARFSHENLVEKFKIFVQDFVPIRTALRVRNVVDATRFWVHGCEPGRVSDGSRLALCQTLSIECPSSIFLWPVYFVIPVPFSLSFFVCLCVCVFLLLSLELGRCSSDLFLPSRPRTGLATTYNTGYG